MSARKDVLEALVYGNDPRITPGDRLKALEALRSEERSDAAVDGLEPAEVERALDDFYSAMIGAMFVASGAASIETGELDPARYPQTAQALTKLVGRLVERVTEEREALGHWGELIDPLPAPEEPESEPEDAEVEKEDGALSSGAARGELLPPGIDLSRGWPR